MSTPAAGGPLAGLISDAREIPAPFQPPERRDDQPMELAAGRTAAPKRIEQPPVGARSAG